MQWRFEGLCKSYGDIKALSPVTLDLTPGVYGLIGPNGAGKSTWMKLAAGLLKPTAGRILLDGRDIREYKEKYYEHIGYLPQSAGAYPNFTGAEFLTYFGRLKGLSGKAARQSAAELLELFHLSDAAKRKTKTYSGGMRQRLLIAAAMTARPDILILDEPTVGLDPKERSTLLNLLSSLSGDRIVFYSTHIIRDLERIADRVFFLRRGEIAVQGSLQEAVAALSGGVYTALLDGEKLARLEEEAACQVISVRREDGGSLVRYYTEGQPMPDSRPAEPRLEDVYYALFGGDGAEEG